MTTEQLAHDPDRLQSTIALYVDLMTALTDDPKAAQFLVLDSLALLYAADDAERAALAAFAARVNAQRASYLTVKQLAKQWQIKPAEIRRWAEQGLLSGQRRGGGWVFTPQACDRFLKERTYIGPDRAYADAELPPPPLTLNSLPARPSTVEVQ